MWNTSCISHFVFTPLSLLVGCSSCRSRNRLQMDSWRAGSASCECLIRDHSLLQNKISAIQKQGSKSLQVITDFDATLTRYWINGIRGQSCHSLLQQGNPEYDAKRQQLRDYYHPLEFSTTIPLDHKEKLMEEWWGKTHALLVEGGLSYSDIKTSVANANIAFRDGVAEFFEYLEERNIPVLIFSAGLADIIEEVLMQKLHKKFKNIKIVSNRMLFDENGILVSFIGKTIHVMNKKEHSIERRGCEEEEMGRRRNVVLLGDHIGDLGMSDGIDHQNLISVGFLNQNMHDSIDCYQKAFDVVYMNDAPMWGVTQLLSHLCLS